MRPRIAAAVLGVVLVTAPAGGQPAILGVTDVAVDGAGRIYVADERRRAIVVLDRSLRQTARISGQRTSRARFDDPQAVRALSDSTFAVADRFAREIVVYRWRRGAAVVDQVIPLAFEPYDFCQVSNARLLVLGLHRRMRLHLVDRAGRIVRSMASMDGRWSDIAADHVIQGRLACQPDAGRVVVTSSWLPDVEVFGRLGDTLLSRTTLRPLRRLTITDEKHKVSFSAPRNGYHALGRALFSDGGLVIPALNVGRSDGAPVDTVLWFRIDPRSGALTRWANDRRLFPLLGGTALVVRSGDVTDLSLVRLSDTELGR